MMSDAKIKKIEVPKRLAVVKDCVDEGWVVDGLDEDLTEPQAKEIVRRAETLWPAVEKMKKVCDELNAVFAVLVNSTELPPKDALVAVRQKLQVALAAFEQAEKE